MDKWRPGLLALAAAFLAIPLLAKDFYVTPDGRLAGDGTMQNPWSLEKALSHPATVKPGQSFKECRNCPEMVVVPAGTFMMGSPANEPERRENELQHRVNIARAFAIGKTEVTWDQWEACVRDRWCDGPAIEQALRSNPDGTPNKEFIDWLAFHKLNRFHWHLTEDQGWRIEIRKYPRLA